MSARNDHGKTPSKRPTSDEVAAVWARHGKRVGLPFVDSTGEPAEMPVEELSRPGAVLLRNRDTGQYYGPGGKWVELKEAAAFASSYDAIQTAVGLPEPRLEVMFSFEERHYNICIPIRSAREAIPGLAAWPSDSNEAEQDGNPGKAGPQ